MRVLVTGASSLLGGAVARQLASRGDEVTCFQRRPSDTGCVDVLGDIRDADAVLAAAKGHDAIVHLAALVAPRPLWRDAYEVNVRGTAHVLAAAQSCGRLVHISTPSVAFENVAAIGESARAPSYNGRDAYARSKAIAENLVREHLDVPTVILRPHLVWGPGDTQLVGRIVQRARQGRLVLPDRGRALLDTTFVADAASAIVAGLDRTADSPHAWGTPWVVTGNDPRPLAELVEGILDAAQVHTTLRSLPSPVVGVLGRAVGRWWPGDEPPLTYFAARQLSVSHWFDQRATQDALQWVPAVGVDEGFAQLARWFSAERDDAE